MGVRAILAAHLVLLIVAVTWIVRSMVAESGHRSRSDGRAA